MSWTATLTRGTRAQVCVDCGALFPRKGGSAVRCVENGCRHQYKRARTTAWKQANAERVREQDRLRYQAQRRAHLDRMNQYKHDLRVLAHANDPDRHCLYCNAVLEARWPSRQVYCDMLCRRRAWRERKSAA